jgi:hypothetical protein
MTLQNENDLNRELFEQIIVSKINRKYYSPAYAIKRDKHGNYVKYETKIAWEWWCEALTSKY